MINLNFLKSKIEERFGDPLLYSQQCEALSQAILDFTGDYVSETTLKRIFGFSNRKVEPRKSTLDSLAHYLGYKNWEDLMDEYRGSPAISDFMEVVEINPETLNPGTKITLSYLPDRKLILDFLNGNKFLVVSALNSKLQEGDILTISQIYKDFELIVSKVEREGKDLGGYVAAKETGITSLEILEPID